MIALGSDHGGYDLKCQIEEYLEEKGYEYQDFGCFDRKSCDYPDFGKAAARAVADGQCDRGIVVCTSGIGISFSIHRHILCIEGPLTGQTLLPGICVG